MSQSTQSELIKSISTANTLEQALFLYWIINRETQNNNPIDEKGGSRYHILNFNAQEAFTALLETTRNNHNQTTGLSQRAWEGFGTAVSLAAQCLNTEIKGDIRL